MLQGRLITLALAAATTVAACGGSDGGGAIRENVVEPGVTAIERGGTADQAACGIEASSIRTALESYELLEGDPAPDEAALVDEGYLRAESTLWDVVDGALVAQDPGCDPNAADVPASDIVTTAEPPTAEQVYREFTQEQVAAFGGADCAWELAQIFAAGERFVAETGSDPSDLDALVDGGFLSPRPLLWVFDDGDLVPADDSPCPDLT